MISGSGISFAYGSREVLRNIDLQARHGEVLGLVGPNGSGKTTLLRTLYGSLTPSAGTVSLDHAELHRLNARQIAKTVSVVVQENHGELPLLVSDMVLLGRTPHRGLFSRGANHDEKVAAEALDRVGMLGSAGKLFDELSGGERQRVLIARALAQQTAHLLLDEPTNHLDVRYQHEVLELVRDLARSNNHAVAVILHDLNLAATYCDRLLLLDQGQVVAAGTPSEVLVKENIEPVYQIGVRRVELPDGFQLVFRPLIRPGAANAENRAEPASR